MITYMHMYNKLVYLMTLHFLFCLQVSKVKWDQLDHLVRLEELDKKDQSDYLAEMENRDSREAQDFQVQFKKQSYHTSV